MKTILNILVVAAIILSCSVFYGEDAESRNSGLQWCADEEFGVGFQCDPNWGLETARGVMLIIISEEPAVTMTVAKTYTPVASLSELDSDTLKKMGQYADGFKTERLILANRDTLKVKAFSEEYSEMRLTDYYMIDGTDLYSVLFSVSPKEEWDTYKLLFEDIIRSFKFLH